MELIISNLSKTYPNGVQALSDVHLRIGTGMFGLLGPNGAGKSSLMRTIATLQEPDTGSITFGDIDVLRNKQELRAILGYLPQEFGMYPNLPAETILEHFALLKGVATGRKELVKSLLQQTNLWNVRLKNVGTFSGGMKQRLGIAIALLGNPKLIIVDEPTAGLDPTERNRFLNLLAEISENIVVILSTHIVEDVSELCTNAAIINKGKVVTSGSPQSIIATVKGKLWKKTIEKSALPAMHQQHHIISTRLAGGRPVIHVYAEGIPDDDFSEVEADLEDAYFYTISATDRTAKEKQDAA